MSKAYATEILQKSDEAHLTAMHKMKEPMQSPEAMKAWFDGKRKEYEALLEE